MSFFNYQASYLDRSSDALEDVSTLIKFLIIAEGSKTESCYFTSLADHADDVGIANTIKVQYVDRSEEHKTDSSPELILNQAIEFKDNQIKCGDLDTDDKVMVVFDMDIFCSTDPRTPGPEKLKEIIDKACKHGILLGVTNPSFELFLLLHKENAYENLVKDKSDQLLRNEKINNRRFADKYFSEQYGFNPKKNKKELEKLAFLLPVAIKEEKGISQSLDYPECLGRLTSTIGIELEKLLDDTAKFKELLYKLI